MLPVITIARQYGSGGHEVGEKVAKKLGLPFYDKALIAMATKKSGISEEVFVDADEKAASSLLYSMVMGSYAFGARVPSINEMPINDKLFIIQSDIIKKAAAEGPCVIIGRCADYILREHENCLNVFVHADKAAMNQADCGPKATTRRKKPRTLSPKRTNSVPTTTTSTPTTAGTICSTTT